MRRIPKLTNPNHTDKTFVIDDFTKFVRATGGELTTSGCAVDVLAAVNGVKRYYFVREGHYAYLTNNKVVKYYNGSWREILSTTAEPYIIPFKENGVECTLVVGDSAIIIYDDNQIETLSLPYGKIAVIYKEMLFVAKDNKVLFSKLLDFQNFTGGLDNSGFVITDKDYGDIIALVPTKTVLIIVCERAVYYFSPIGERYNYSLVKQDIALRARDKSVQNAGDKTYVFSEKALCKLQGGNLTKVNCDLDGLNYDFDGQSGVDGNTYYATLRDNSGEKYLFVFNQVTGSQSLIKANSLLLADGGYFLENDKIKRLAERLEAAEIAEWESLEVDFDLPNVKTLVGVAVKCNSPLTLELECSFGKQTLSFEKGFNMIKTNLTDKTFKLKRTASSLNASIERIRFNYRLQEE